MIFVQEAKPPSRRKVLATLEAILDLMPEKPAYVKGVLERADVSSRDAQISELLKLYEGVSVNRRFVSPISHSFQIEWDAKKLSRKRLLALAKSSVRQYGEYIATSEDAPEVKLNEIVWELAYARGEASIVFLPRSMRINISYEGKEPARMYEIMDVAKGNRVGLSVFAEGRDTLGESFIPEKFLSGLEKLVTLHRDFRVTVMPAVEIDYGSVARQLATMDKDAMLAKQGIIASFIPLLANPESVMRLTRNTLSYYASGMAQRMPSLLLKLVRWYFEKTTVKGMNLSVNLFDSGGNKLLDVPHIELDSQIEKDHVLQVRKAFAGSGVNLYVRGN